MEDIMKMIQRILVVEKEDENGDALLDVRMDKCLDRMLEVQSYQKAISKQELLEKIFKKAIETELKSQRPNI